MAKADVHVKRDSWRDFEVEIDDVEVHSHAIITINERGYDQIIEHLRKEMMIGIDWEDRNEGPVIDIGFDHLDSLQVSLPEVLREFYPSSAAKRDAFVAMLEAEATRLKALQEEEFDE